MRVKTKRQRREEAAMRAARSRMRRQLFLILAVPVTALLIVNPATARHFTAYVLGDLRFDPSNPDHLDAIVYDATRKQLVLGMPTATAAAHASSHQNNGSDEISVAGLSGLLADGQTPLAHKASHDQGGSDALTTANPTNTVSLDAGAGTAAGYSRSDHTHGLVLEGLHSDDQTLGYITKFKEGSNITFTMNGGVMTIAASGGGTVTTASPISGDGSGGSPIDLTFQTDSPFTDSSGVSLTYNERLTVTSNKLDINPRNIRFDRDVEEIATDTVIGRDTAGNGSAEELTLAGALAITGGAVRTQVTAASLLGNDSAGTNATEQLTLEGMLAFGANTVRVQTTAAGLVGNDSSGTNAAELITLVGPLAFGSNTLTTSMNTNKLIGRYSASTGVMQEITISTGLSLDGSGNLTASGATEATQSEMETPTGSTQLVTPRRVQQHPGVCKAWINYENDGTAALLASYNVDGVADDAVGQYTVTFTTDFAATTYCIAAASTHDTVGLTNPPYTAVEARNLGTCQLQRERGGAAEDDFENNVAFFGDQ